MTESTRHLFLEKSQQFRVNIRQQQLSTFFSTKRLKFSIPPPYFMDFHLSFSSLSEPALQSSLSTLKQSMVANSNPLSYSEVIKTEMLPDILIILGKFQDNPLIIADLYWIIGDLCSGESAFTTFFTSNEVGLLEKSIDFIIKFREKDQDQLLSMIFFTLGNIVGSESSMAKILLKLDILNEIVEIFKIKRPLSLIQEITWFLSVFLDTKSNLLQKSIEKVYPVIAYCLLLDDVDVLRNSLWAGRIFFMNADLTFIKCSIVIIDRVIKILNNMTESVEVEFPAVYIVGSLLSGSDEVARMLISKGILDIFATKIEVKALKSQICWCIGNLLACEAEDILVKVFRHNILMKKILEVLVIGKNNEKREILYGLIESLKNLRVDSIRGLFARGLNEVLDVNLKSIDLKLKVLALKGVKILGKRGKDIFREDGVNELIERMDNEIDLGRVIEGIYNDEGNGETHRLSLKILEKYYYF